MVKGANRSGARKKVFRRTTSKTVERYVEKRSKAARCVSGRPLPGTARGTKTQVGRLSKTQRRPSRPFGGVLSAPVLREGLRMQAHMQTEPQDTKLKGVYTPGRLCMKIAGRDAGKLCVIVDEKDGKFLIDGQTRRRLVSRAHIEPLLQEVAIKKGAATAEVAKAFESAGYPVPKAPTFPGQKKTA